MADRTNTWAHSYINFAQRFRFPLALLALFMMFGSLYYTKENIKLNNDLSALLPDNTPSVKALKEANQRFGSTDRFMIAIQASDPALIAKLQDEIKSEIDKNWKDLSIHSQVSRDNHFFENSALLYLPVHHLRRIEENLVHIQNKINRNNILTVDLLEDEETEEKELVWFDASIPEELGLPDEAARSFSKFFDAKEDETVKKEKEWNPKAAIPDSLKARLIGQHKIDKTFNGVVIAKLMEPSTNLNFTQKILDRSGEMLKKFKARSYPIPVRFSVEGTYEGLKDMDDMKSDGMVSTYISIGAILLLLLLFFRSFSASMVLLGQVGFACSLMLAFTTFYYGQLNPFTLFVAAIILGMGIDFSIHVIGTAQRLQGEKSDFKEALAQTILHLTKPMTLAAITTIAGLLTLLVADFKGFYEFGVIASVGIAFSIVSAILGLPVILLILENKSILNRNRFLKFFLGGLPQRKAKSLFPAHWKDSHVTQFLGRAGVTLLVVSLLMTPLLGWTEFEHNMRNLRADRKQNTKVKKQKMHASVALDSKRKSSQPVAVFGDALEELQALHDTLMHRRHVEKDPYLRSFLTLSTFVPPESKQEDRLDVIEDISDLINDESFDMIDEEYGDFVKQLRTLVRVEGFGPEDIPSWALDLLREKDGSYGKIGFIYGSFESWNARDVAKFQDKYSKWNFGKKDLRAFSSSFIFSDVIRAVKSDSVKMAFLVTLVLLLTLAFSLRNVKQVLIASISLGLGVLLTMEFMGFFNFTLNITKVGIYNVIVIPTLLGVGIDATIHLLSTYIDSPKGIKHMMDTTGKMVVASSLTTAGGFFGVLFISHKGMRTIGELAVLGIFCTLIASLTITPWLCSKWIPKKTTKVN